MELPELTKWLEIRLRYPLPGKTAQLKMSSMARIRELLTNSVPDKAVKSGVLILLYPKNHDTGIVLMRRPEYSGVHSGQISLPGGKAEPTDNTIVETATREAREEIGIDPGKFVLLGSLTPLYIPPSNFIVTPVLGYYSSTPLFIPDDKEVAEIIEIGLNELIDVHNIQRKNIRLNHGFSLKVPSYFINGNIIWGATAMILSEFRELLLEFNTSGSPE